MANTALKKIQNEAKKLRKAHPKMEYKTALKQAGAKYRAGKIAGVKKTKPAKKVSYCHHHRFLFCLLLAAANIC